MKNSTVRKKVYIHMGFHKTGTSVIQEALHQSKKNLGRHDIHYPDSLLGFPAQQELAWTLIKEKRKWMKVDFDSSYAYGNLLEAFEKSDKKNLVISSEDFTFLEKDEAALHSLKRWFKDYEIKIICYIREPVDFLISLYNHRLRVGDTCLSFEEYLIKKMNPNVAMFNKRIEPWEKVFGCNSVFVRSYDFKRFRGGSILKDFSDALECNVELNHSTNFSNEGIHPYLSDVFMKIHENMDEGEEKSAAIESLLRLKGKLPKVSSKRIYISEEFLSFLNKLYKPMKDEVRLKYNVII